jgi:hypothetical protein
VLALVAFVVAAQRLAISTELPGLAAIELILLALPWSLLLEVPGLRQAGWLFMTVTVLGGILLNALIFYVPWGSHCGDGGGGHNTRGRSSIPRTVLLTIFHKKSRQGAEGNSSLTP